MKKNFKLSSSEIERLIPDIGGALATDMITVHGKKVDYMVREQPRSDEDSGWAFYGGGETQEYLDDPDNTSLFNVNTIANYDSEIIGFLTYPPGTEIERNKDSKLEVISQNIPEPDVIFLYPTGQGVVQITEQWSFSLSAKMLRRVDKGSLVIWRPGFTIWLTTYSPKDVPLNVRLETWESNMSPAATNLEKVVDNGLGKLRYWLAEETDGELQSSAYIFGSTEKHEIHLASARPKTATFS